MQTAFIHGKRFWMVFCCAAMLLSVFFAWELNLLQFSFLPVLPRPEPTGFEKIFTMLLILFLSFDVGLLAWRLEEGHCPVGAKRATFFSGALGFIALLCPVCLLLPISLLGITVSLTFLLPYLPLLRTIVLFLLIATTIILWPKQPKKRK